MRFRVGGTIYRVRVTEGPLVSDADEVVAGLFDWQKGTIWISGELPESRREETLLHELKHAWRHHYGPAADEEAECNRTAAFVRDIMQQYLRQGGEWTLKRLRPDGVVDATVECEDAGTAELAGGDCPVCGTRFANHQITTSPPRHDSKLDKPVVDRMTFCPHCDKEIRWTETCTLKGAPTGRIVEGPSMVAPKRQPGERYIVAAE